MTAISNDASVSGPAPAETFAPDPGPNSAPAPSTPPADASATTDVPAPSTADAIRFEEVYKLFGPQPHGYAFDLAAKGHSKDEIMQWSGHVLGLQNVNISIKRGEIFVIMGLSGSGKSTALRAVNQLLTTTHGHVWVDETDVQQLKGRELQAFRREKIGMVFQHFALFPHRNIIRNVGYGLKVQRLPKSERLEAAMKALALVGLEAYADRMPGQLSGGQQQRVGLARALASNSDILLMDEPFSALDPLIRHQIQGELMELHQKLKKTILFITHDLNEAVRIGHRVCIMRDGRIEQVGTPADILTHPVNDYVAGFIRNVDQGRAIQVSEVMSQPSPIQAGMSDMSLAEAVAHIGDGGGEFVVDSSGAPTALLAVADGLRAIEMGTTDLAAALRTDFERTSPTARLNEIYRAAGRGLPIAVVSEANQLVGTLYPHLIMEKMGTAEEQGATAEERYT